MKKNKHNYKVTDEQFIEAFRASEGNYSQTAKYIEEHFGIPYTRQSAQERAEQHPEEIEKMYDIMENESMAAIMDFARDITLDLKFRGRMYALVLREVSRRKRMKIMAEKAKQQAKKMPEGAFQFGDYILRFPNRGVNQLTPEEAEKERREILAGINGEYDKPKPDAPSQTADNE